DATQHSGRAYGLLEELCDDVGARPSGSVALEHALAWAERRLKDQGLQNAHIEPVEVEHWERGSESLELVEPRMKTLRMLGLGGSVATPKGGITAEVVVVRSADEAKALGDKAAGKIVLFDVAMPPYDPKTGDTGYGKVVGIRVGAARMAAAGGAVAALVRSLTATSLGAPHAGAMRYEDAKTRIPAAAISVEDAELLGRLAGKGKVTVKLVMQAGLRPNARSGNVVAQLDGRERPEEIVLISGHIDSWDVGQGAQDDGAGVVAAMEALALLKRLELQPRRSVRAVLWTNEETNLAGAKQYAKDHAAELPKHVVGMESDTGGTKVVQLSLELADKSKLGLAHERLARLTPVLAQIDTVRVADGFSGADLEPLRAAGVPGIGVLHDTAHYFDVHHSDADTLDKVSSAELDQSVAVLALTAYVLADMPETLL
ncbi:MAG: M20/M25/M40 family metallo-hydrolase, partial [Polyangiales bacterium]